MDRVSDWKSIATAPADADLELSIHDEGEYHALVFPCRREGSSWRDVGANRLMPLQPSIGGHGGTVAFDQASGPPAVVAIGRTSMPVVEHAFQNATTPRRSQQENQMTAIAETGP